MPDAVKFILGADSAPFSREMRQMEAIAQSSGRNIGARMAEGAHMGYSGILRESITIPREIIEGRGIGRVIGSSSILLAYLSQLSGKSKEAGYEAQALSEVWDRMAYSASNDALSAAKRARELETLAKTQGWMTQAEYAEMGALQAQIPLLTKVAQGYKAKAAAMAEDAAAARLNAVPVTLGESIAGFFGMAVNPVLAGIGLVVGALGGLWFAWHRAAQEAKNYEVEVKLAFTGDDVVRHARGINAVADAWARIAENVNRASDEYNGAVASAERLEQIARTTDEHQTRMAELQHRINMAGARTPAAEAAERQRFAAQQDAMLQQQNAAAQERLRQEAYSENDEARNLRERAAGLRTPGGMTIEGEATAAGNLENALKRAKEAREWLTAHPAIEAPVRPAGGSGGSNEGAWGLYDQQLERYQLDQQTRSQMQGYITGAANLQGQAEDQAAGRRNREALLRQAQQDEERARHIADDLTNRIERDRLHEQQAREERNLELGLEQSEGRRRVSRAGRGELNAAQRQGFSYLYGAPAHDQGMELARRSEAHLQHIQTRLDELTQHADRATRIPPGAGRR